MKEHTKKNQKPTNNTSDVLQRINTRPTTRLKRKHLSIDAEKEALFQKVKINWIPALFLLGTPLLAILILPWYIYNYDFTLGAWVVFALFMIWTGLSITAGYHRLWSHKTYSASLPVRFFLLVGATMAVQSSIFDWCSGHREHHKYVDDVYKDPYSAKRGFWFSHIGWMLRHYPSGTYNYRNIKDLQADPMLRAQHNHYHWWVLLSNTLIPMGVGYLVGDVWGTLLLAGLLRIVLTHHSTFFINSLAHIWGTQPYTDENTARDNGVLAFFTWGEGYHNYHHIFEHDYRNGIRWWQYDPTKWLIYSLYKLGLTSDLKRVPDLKIQEAKLAMQFKRANEHIEKSSLTDELQQFKQTIAHEYETFLTTLDDWKTLKNQALQEKIAEKKAHAMLEKAMLEAKISDKFNETMEQQREKLEQLKQNMSSSLPISLKDKLNQVDNNLSTKLKEIEHRMKEQQKQVAQVVAQYSKQLSKV